MAFLQQSSSNQLPVFFNINGNVGRNSPNQAEDVALVSFLIVTMAEAGPGPKTKAAAAKVTIGVANEAFFQCIDEIQRQWKEQTPASKVDGHISKANAGTTYSGGNVGFMICVLNYKVAKAYPDVWPRLDRVPKCPGSVAALVNRTLIAT